MTRIINLNIFFLMLLFLLSGRMSAQSESVTDTARNSFAVCPESAFIHTDREIYIAGENLFFKLYITPDKKLSSRQISSIGYIVLRNEKTNILNLIIKLKYGNSFGAVYLPDTLKTGMYEMVGFTNYMKNFDERNFFRKEILIVNRFDKTLDDLYSRDSSGTSRRFIQSQTSGFQDFSSEDLKIILEKDSFKIREKIKLGVQWKNPKMKQGMIHASVNVKAISPLTRLSSPFVLSLTDTGARYNAGKMPGSYSPYYAEEKGIYIRGKITTQDHNPLKDECLFISTFDSAANLQYAFSNDSGNFQFLLDNYYLGKTLLLKSWNRGTHIADNKIELEDKFRMKMPYSPVMPDININLKKYIFSSQDLVQINKMYRAGKNMVNEPSAKSEKVAFPALYYQAGTVVYPSNYVPLDNFDEISSNILKGFMLRKNKGVYYVYLFDVLTKSVFPNPALVFLDGIYINDISQIMNLSSEDIGKIEICNNLRMKGILEFPGLVSITTKRHTADFSRYSASSLVFRIDGYSDRAYFTASNYDKKSTVSHLPDFRQLLFWNPEVELKVNESNYYEFYCSDYFAEYLIEFIGITNEGKQLSAYKKIKVYR